VYSTAGDRRDVDLIRQGELIGQHFDRVILYEGDYMRNRESGDIIRLIKEGMKNATRATEIIPVQGAIPATELALKMVQPDELLVIQADVVDDTVLFLRQNFPNMTTPVFEPAPVPRSARIS